MQPTHLLIAAYRHGFTSGSCEVLLLQDAGGPDGAWHLPAGLADDGAPEDAAARILQEEAGLTGEWELTDLKYSFTLGGDTYAAYGAELQREREQVKGGEGVGDFRWAEAEEAHVLLGHDVPQEAVRRLMLAVEEEA